VVVTDDVASAPASQVGDRRGIAGDLTVFKVAGAAAESGLDLDEVERLARKANSRTRTLGVAFMGCTLPGAQAPLFTVPAGQMSIGLGIHGEPGIRDVPVPCASDLAEFLVTRLLEERPEGRSDRAVVLVNGLGAVKYEELFVLYGQVAAQLERQGVQIAGAECGELVTSLDMSGLSLTLFWVDEELDAFWAAPADTPAYRRPAPQGTEKRRAVLVTGEQVDRHEAATEASQNLARLAVLALEATAGALHAHEKELGDIDAVAGDGDHGAGMRRGADGALESARTALRQSAGVRELLARAGDQWCEQAGGSSGALWSAGLMAMASSLGNRGAYTANDLVEAVAAAREAVVALGQAEPGDKTLVDALAPFVETLRTAVARGDALAQAVRAAAQAAEQAAAQTAPMRPRKGRARPLADRSVGTPDPGAVSLALVVSAVASSIGLWGDRLAASEERGQP
jgi:dihydroxyacetone kinase